jgi:hypothetical protein
MEKWPDQLKLFPVLSSIKVLLELVSKNDGWSFESPEKTLEILNKAIAFYLDPELNDFPEKLSTQFGPTGPLQEISISNGWSEIYLKMAEQYD